MHYKSYIVLICHFVLVVTRRGIWLKNDDSRAENPELSQVPCLKPGVGQNPELS